MAARTFFLACMLACCCSVVLAGDRTLGTVPGACKDMFNTAIKTHYATDKECADLIKQAMSTVPKSDADCPKGVKADAGSAVQKCMSKNQAAKDDWVKFIKNCEILNVNERTGAGEAEAAATAKPSCFPRFNSLSSFKEYMEGKGAAKSAAAPAKAGGVLLGAAAAAGLCLLL